MKPTGDFSRYYCFDHQQDFESRMDAARHLVQVHEVTGEQAMAKLDEIDEMYDDMDNFDDEIQ
jgi:hypothetical protein